MLAKHLSDRHAKIELTDMKRAVNGLSIIDAEAKKLFRKHFKMRTFREATYTQAILDEAANSPRKPFSEEVKFLKNMFEEEGFSLSVKVSEVKEEEQPEELEQPEEPGMFDFFDEDNEASATSFATIKKKIQNLRAKLQESIYDLDDAIEAICDNMMADSYHEGNAAPKSIYLFLGPPATGKTYMTQLMKEHMPGFDAIKVFDMTQYTHEDSGGGLFGTNRMWGNAAPGALTTFVKENPKSIVVFDEFEKADTKVQGNLLSILSGGYLNDACGWCRDGKPWTADKKENAECTTEAIQERVDFTNTIIVFTSNLGQELYSQQSFLEQMKADPLTAQSTILESISREKKIQHGNEVSAITPEMLSRLGQGQLVLFNKLSLGAFATIAGNKMTEIQKRFYDTFAIEVNISEFESLITALVLSFAPNIDARRIKAKLHLSIFDKLTDYLLHADELVSKVNISLDEKSQKFMKETILSASDDEKKKYLRDLFRRNETLVYEETFKTDKKTLQMTFTNLTKAKLPKAIDFGGEGGFVFDVPELNFSDIAGHEQAKERLNEVIQILKNPKKLTLFETKPPKGMLLYGPPGTGKTMLAQAFASEADLPFISTTGADLLEPVMYDNGEKIDKMQALFKRAQEYAPSIVFIDEIDSFGSREAGGYTQAINKLLTSLNGFSSNPDEMVFVIAATNFKERIDSAIIRPGRIGLHLEIAQLDKNARRYFIEKILKKPTSGDFDVDRLVMLTAGMTGAELAKVGQESALYVVRNAYESITQEIITEQVNIIKYGEKLNIDFLEKLLESTAYHEAAHAVLTYKLIPERTIEQITVVPRKGALGFVSYNLEDEVSNLTRAKIRAMICVTMAGREAQIYKYGEEGIDSGASNDLKQATKYAHYAIAHLGMDEEIGYINVSGVETPLLGQQIDLRVQAWLKEAQNETIESVKLYWKEIDIIAQALLKEEMITENRFKTLLS